MEIKVLASGGMMNPSLITDIHAHVLAGIDDGPETVEDSRQLIGAFSEQGTDRVIATPHFCNPHFAVSEMDMQRAYNELLEGVIYASRIEVARGAEVRLAASLTDVILADNVPTLRGTKYVLVEFRSDKVSSQEVALIHELMVRGYAPVMAHPERNLAVQKLPQILDELIERGVIMQLTAYCFHGEKETRMAEKVAWQILEKGCKAVIASDAHNCTTRPPGLQLAYDNISMRLGTSVVNSLIENANAIWSNEPLDEILVTAPPKRGILHTLLGRRH